MTSYFADPACSMQLFPSQQAINTYGVIVCDNELVPNQGIQTVAAWKYSGSQLTEATYLYQQTADGCVKTPNVPGQYGYAFLYLVDPIPLDQATRQVWVCE